MRFTKLPHSTLFGVLILIFFISISSACHAQSTEEFKGSNSQIEVLLTAGNFEQAITAIDAYTRNIKNKLTHEQSLTLQLLEGRAYYGLAEGEKAIQLLLSGFDEVSKTAQMDKLKYQYASYLGKYFAQEGNFDKSNEYYYIALNNKDTSEYTLPKLRAYIAIGKNFHATNQLDKAVYNFNKILAYKDIDSTQGLISETYTNLGIIASKNENFTEAEAYFQDALKIEQGQKDTIAMTGALINLSSFYYATGEFQKANENYLRAYQTIENVHSSDAVELKEYALYNLAYTANQLEDYKNAYQYLDQASELTDSIAQTKIKRNISEVEAKYNVAKEAQRTEEEKSKAQRAQFLFYGSLLTIFALILIGYFFYRNYRLKQLSKIEKIENESQTKIINATIDAKEKERKSIAETLHDSVSALLSSANLHLQATKSQLKTDAPQEIQKAQNIVNEASVKIRDLSHKLISSVLLKFGLAFAIHDICQKYSNSEIALHSDDKGIQRYDQDFEIKIHNIIEELINNILKHSKASHATIMLEHKSNDKLSIRISDDGIGFNPKKVKSKDGLGLSHINARIKVMKGVFKIVSAQGNGTSIFIEVPVLKKQLI